MLHCEKSRKRLRHWPDDVFHAAPGLLSITTAVESVLEEA
jgi:hypothetical protein